MASTRLIAISVANSVSMLLESYPDTLFIFPDTVFDHHSADSSNFDKHHQATGEDFRPFNRHGNCKSRPRTAGIPIKWDPIQFEDDYFEFLDDDCKKQIDLAIAEIKDLVIKHKYKQLGVLSTNAQDKKPFTFEGLGKGVRNYINQQLKTVDVFGAVTPP